MKQLQNLTNLLTILFLSSFSTVNATTTISPQEDAEIKAGIRFAIETFAFSKAELGNPSVNRVDQKEIIGNLVKDIFESDQVIIEDDLLHNSQSVRNKKVERYLADLYLHLDEIFSIEHTNITISNLYENNGNLYASASYKRTLYAKDKKKKSISNEVSRTASFKILKDVEGNYKPIITYVTYTENSSSLKGTPVKIINIEAEEKEEKNATGNSDNVSSEATQICNSQPIASLIQSSSDAYCLGFEETINLDELLTNETPKNGKWVGKNLISTTMINLKNFKVPGDYSFEYTIIGTYPCKTVTTSYTLVLRECVAASNGKAEVKELKTQTKVSNPSTDYRSFGYVHLGGSMQANKLSDTLELFNNQGFGYVFGVSFGSKNYHMGVNVEFQSSKNTFPISEDDETFDYRLNRTKISYQPYFRYDIINGKRFEPFVQVGIDFNRDSLTTLNKEGTVIKIDDDPYYGYRVGLGFEIKLDERGKNSIEAKCLVGNNFSQKEFINPVKTAYENSSLTPPAGIENNVNINNLAILPTILLKFSFESLADWAEKRKNR